MKATRFISLFVAALFMVLTPSLASADGYPPTGGGVSNGGTQPSGNGCFTTTVTVTGEPNDRLTLIVTNDDGDVVYQRTKRANAQGDAKFRVRLCEPGTYTATGYASDGTVLGTTQIVIPGSGGGDGAGSGSSDGSLPSTGSSTQDMLALGGGLALVIAGGAALVAARRRSNA